MSTEEIKCSVSAAIASKDVKRPLIFIISAGFGEGKDHYRAVIFKLLKAAGEMPLAVSFADHFKIEVVSKDRVDFNKVFGEERDAETRKLLQLRGSEEGISRYGADIWTNTVETIIKVQFERGITAFIIADCRFPHELEWGKKMGAHIIRLEAPGRHHTRAMKEAKGDEKLAKERASHISETALDDPKYRPMFDIIVKNDYGDEVTSLEAVTGFVNSIVSKIFEDRVSNPVTGSIANDHRDDHSHAADSATTTKTAKRKL